MTDAFVHQMPSRTDERGQKAALAQVFNKWQADSQVALMTTAITAPHRLYGTNMETPVGTKLRLSEGDLG